MRLLVLLFVVSAIMESSPCQTNVDRIADELDFLSKGSLNNWKYSTNFAGDPTKPAFDDAQWETLKLNQSIFPDSCWLRREVVLPDRVLGEPIKGTVRFLVSVDDYGYLWVNGESKGLFPWDGEFVLTDNAKPGQKFIIAIKAINTGGPLRLIRAQLASDVSTSLKQQIDNFALSLRVGQKLLSFDTYQTNARVKVDPGIDRSTMDAEEKKRLNALLQAVAAQTDVDALKSGDVPRFTASLDAARAKLRPVADFAKRFTLFFDANAHIDAAWLWRSCETVEVCHNTFSSVIIMMNARPDFTYTQGSAAYYDWMEQRYPELFTSMQQRIREGRWEVVGGMWIEPDCNLPGGESWARQLLYAKRYFRKKLGVDVAIGWNPDSFGYNWNMPMFYRHAGIDAFITQKIGWNDTNVFPYRVFWWESPDSSRILSYFPFDYVNTVDDPLRLVDWLRQFEANTGFTRMMILFGVGDHGGGPSLEMLQRIDRLASLDIFPAIEHGTAGKYLAWLKQQDLKNVPVWDDELYLEYHRGTFTTQAAMKQLNRSEETLMTNAEKFSTIATLVHGNDYRPALEEAWRKVLFNQFHDILPGSGIREVYIDATETHHEAAAIGKHVLTNSLDLLASRVNTSQVRKGKPVVVFNPLAWERSDVVRFSFPNPGNEEHAIFGPDGKEIPSQVISTKLDTSEILFRADAVPSLGYATYELRTQKPLRYASVLSVDPTHIENEYFRVTIDPDSGWVKSIVDKRNHMELLQACGNRLQVLEDKPSAWDAWNIGLTGMEFASHFRRAEVVESGPVRCVLRLCHDYLKPGVKKDFPTEDFPSSFFVQDIVVYAGIDRIDFITDADWWEDKTMLKVAFPLSFSDSTATYEIPYGTIQRSTQSCNSLDKAKFEVPAQRWADLSHENFGVSLLNKSKYGYDIKGNVMRLSLLRSPQWPDPTADRGKHRIEYALYPHMGTWRDGGTVRRGYEYNDPLSAVMTGSHGGSLPAIHSFVSVVPANVVLATIKKAEDDDAWVLQLNETRGTPSDAILTLPRVPDKVLLSDLLEVDGKPLAHENRRVTVPIARYGMTTVKVYF